MIVSKDSCLNTLLQNVTKKRGHLSQLEIAEDIA